MHRPRGTALKVELGACTAPCEEQDESWGQMKEGESSIRW